MLALFVINSEFDPYLEFNNKKKWRMWGRGRNAIVNRCIPYASMCKSNPIENKRTKEVEEEEGFGKYVFLGYSPLFNMSKLAGFFFFLKFHIEIYHFFC